MTDSAYTVVLLRHGQTIGYDGDLGLTPLGERQARELGTALAGGIAAGTVVRMPHARTARAAATAVALRKAMVEGIAEGVELGELYPEPWFDNVRFSLDGAGVDTSVAVTTRLGMHRTAAGGAAGGGALPDWAREYDRFDTDYHAAAAAGTPIDWWLHNPTLWFEPPHLAAHRMWRGVAAAADGHGGGRPLLVVVATHSAPMRAFAAAALGYDPGEPENLEDIRVDVGGDLRAEVVFRGERVPFTGPPALPPWVDEAWLSGFGR